MSESKFVNPEKWKEIKRGYFYQAAMYYLSDTEQPLRFVDKSDNHTYTINKKIGNFDPVTVDGKLRAVEQDIVITVKPRQVIVLSNNKLNQSKQFEYVQVLPVFSLSYENSKQGWYSKLVQDIHLGFAYLPRRKGFGLAVDLTQVSTIHKSLLLRKQSKVPYDRMTFIESQLLELLDL